jgi:glucose uptake protein
MIPTSQTFAILALLVSLLCWGTWANTQKAAGKWRFELYYLDFAIGALLFALLAAFSLGSMGDGFTFEDNLAITGKRQMALAAGSGAIFNLGNMLLAAATALAGMAVAFPLALGMAMIVSVIWNLVANPAGSVGVQAGGLVVMLVAVTMMALANRARALEKATGRKKESGLKGTLLGVFGGVLLGLYPPMLAQSRAGDLGLAPYGALVFFALGIILSTLLYSLYFMNLPVQGDAVPLKHYWRKPHSQHVWGLVGGAIWSLGALALFAAASVAKELNAGSAATLALPYGSGLLAALCGLFVWKEFAAASGGPRGQAFVAVALFLVGVLVTAFGLQMA